MDTSISNSDQVKVDVWHYADDELQSIQQRNADKSGFMVMYHFDASSFIVLENATFPKVFLTNHGDGCFFYSSSDSGRRIERQWQGYTLNDIYAIHPLSGRRDLIVKNFKGSMVPSSTGRYTILYDEIRRKYYLYNADRRSLKVIANNVKVSLYDEQNDWPDDPKPYGVVKWFQADSAVLISDRYDIWKVQTATGKASNITGNGRMKKWQYRFIDLNSQESFISDSDTLFFTIFDERDKSSGLALLRVGKNISPTVLFKEDVQINSVQKARSNNVLLYSKQSYVQSPDLYTLSIVDSDQKRLSHINPQQQKYFWGTTELYSWRTFDGKKAEGLLYKPENFDRTKKYPMIVHYDERRLCFQMYDRG